MQGEQSVGEYKSWAEARNKDVPKVLTEEQKEKKRKNLELLRTKHHLKFDVWVPASSLEKQQEDQRVSEIEAEEDRLSKEEPDAKTGKRKRLSKQKESQKKRKIVNGLKPIDWVISQTESLGLLAKSVFPGEKGNVGYTIASRKGADGQDTTVLRISHANSGATIAEFVLPGRM
jgi:hypothetical protein